MFWVQKYEKNKISLAFAVLIFAKLFTSYALVLAACTYFKVCPPRIFALWRVLVAMEKEFWIGVQKIVLAW